MSGLRWPRKGGGPGAGEPQQQPPADPAPEPPNLPAEAVDPAGVGHGSPTSGVGQPMVAGSKPTAAKREGFRKLGSKSSAGSPPGAAATAAPNPPKQAKKSVKQPSKPKPAKPPGRREIGPVAVVTGSLLLIGAAGLLGYLAGQGSSVLTFSDAMAIAAARSGYQPTATAVPTPDAGGTPIITMSPTPVPTGSVLVTPTPVPTGSAMVTPTPVPTGATSTATPGGPAAPTASPSASGSATTSAPAQSSASPSPTRSASAAASAAAKDTTPDSDAQASPSKSSSESARVSTQSVPVPGADPSTTATTSPAVAPQVDWIDTKDLDWGKCPATFRAAISVQTTGTVDQVRVSWSDPASGTSGSQVLDPGKSGRHSGRLKGLPTNAAVLVVAMVTGPAGTAYSEPSGLSHYC